MSKLICLLSAALKKHAGRAALSIDGQLISYRAIDKASQRMAIELEGQNVGILTGRSLETYAGVLAAVRSGRTYVPLNAEFPDHRLLRIVADIAIKTLIVDRDHLDRAIGLLRHIEQPLCVVVLDKAPPEEAVSVCQQHEFRLVGGKDLANLSDIDVWEESDQTPLYILSTSGSTGAPKSIAIPRSNVVDYLGAINDLFDLSPDDRFSHFFKLSFDLSVHDIFVAWVNGGCLYVPGAKDLLDPIAFARRNALTVWFSVPSLVGLAMMSRKLKPDVLPDLRLALFCGEALSWEAVDAFQLAAPNARIANLYGPTEATIAITCYSVDHKKSPETRLPGSVPIGHAFFGQEAVVVGPDLAALPRGESGELVLGGSQLAPGYLNNPSRTADVFVDLDLPGSASKRWYRTGDIAMDTPDGLVFLGRRDTQIKFRGYRIELGEIEAVLQRVAKTPLAIVIAWPPFSATGPIERLLGFVMPPHADLSDVHAMMRDQLPAHMVPSRILSLDQPIEAILNDNRKIDRNKVAQIYQGCTV